MYLQTRKEAKAAKTKQDIEQPSKLDEKSVLADVILQTVPREAQIGSPIGSPVLNGYRREISNDNTTSNNANKEGGETNNAFVKDDNNHEDFERKKNEINKNVSQTKTGVDNEGFDGNV